MENEDGKQEVQGPKVIKLEKLVNEGIDEGVELMIKSEPIFKQDRPNLIRLMDRKKLNDYFAEVSDYVKQRDGEVNPDYIIEKVKGDVASGRFLTDKGKGMLVERTLNSKELVKGEQYVGKAMASFLNLYTALKKGDYAQRMPELLEAMDTIYDSGLLSEGLDGLYEVGVLDKYKYQKLKKAAVERTKKGVESASTAIQSYTRGEPITIPMGGALSKAAAVIVGVTGIGVLVTSNNITGNAIGISSATSLPALLFGLAAVVTGCWLFFKRTKKGARVVRRWLPKR